MSGATNPGPVQRPCPDGGRIHDHLCRSGGHFLCGALDSEGIWVFHRHHGLDPQLLSMGLCVFSDTWRVAGRSHRATTGADTDCELVVGVYLRHDFVVERGLDGADPLSVWDGRGGSVSHCDTVAFALDAAYGARICAGCYACRVAFGRGSYAGACGVDYCEVGMAVGVCLL